METNEKYVLVTGASTGIGYELAKLFAKDGYKLFIVSRDLQKLDKVAAELAQEYNTEVIPVQKDLFKKEEAFELYDEIKMRGIDIDILVNNAGQGQYGEFTDTDINREIDIINLNIVSVVILTKLFLQDMVKRGNGKILNLSSIASKVPGPWQSVYHGTKAFIQSFTEAIRSEVKDKGITVTALLPGATATDFFNKADMLAAKNVQDGKLADASEVAQDGYDALMKGDDMVVSGFKNKMQVAMGNILPDETVANKVYKQQAPKEEEQEKVKNQI